MAECYKLFKIFYREYFKPIRKQEFFHGLNKRRAQPVTKQQRENQRKIFEKE